MHKHWFSMLSVAALLAVPALVRADDPDQQTKQTQAQRPSVGLMVSSLPDEEGVVVRRVYPDSAAAQAGLRRGDVITRVDGREVGDADTLINVLARHRPGEKLRFHIMRNDQAKDLTVTLGHPQKMQTAQEQEPGSDERGSQETGQSSRAFLGVQTVPIDEMSDRMKKRLGVSGEEGVVVIEVLPDSPAAKAGLQHGDVIQRLNNKDVANPESLWRAIQQAGVNKRVDLKVQRGGQKMDLHAKLQAAPQHIGIMPSPGGQGLSDFFSRRSGYGAEEQRQMERMERQIQRLERRIEELENQLNQQRPKRGPQE